MRHNKFVYLSSFYNISNFINNKMAINCTVVNLSSINKEFGIALNNRIRCCDWDIDGEERIMKEDPNMNSDREELIEKGTNQTDESKKLLSRDLEELTKQRDIQTDQLKKFLNSTIKTSDVMPLSNATFDEFNLLLQILMALPDMGWYWPS